jgi:hypothetical protein
MVRHEIRRTNAITNNMKNPPPCIWIALTAAGTWWIWVGARDPIEEANEALRRRRRP